MRTAEHLSQYRNKTHPMYGSTDELGMNGFFVIPLNEMSETFALVICSDGTEGPEWEHVSVRIGVSHGKGKNRKMIERTPRWDEMCAIKKLFWRDDEVVMQLHPAESDYVNIHPHVLHLWKPINQPIPLPPLVAV